MRMKIFFLGVLLLGVSACGTQEDTEPTDQPECGNGLDSGSLNVHTGGDTAEGGETGEIHDTHQGSDTGKSVGHGDTGEMNQYFEVDQFGVFFDGAVLDGEVSSWSSSGISKQGNFVVFAADSDWDGTLEDEDHSCQIWFEFGSLTVTHEPSFVAAGAWEGWTLDTSPAAFLGQMGTCENFDPTIWDLGLYDYVSQNTWGLGVGPLPSELQKQAASVFL